MKKKTQYEQGMEMQKAINRAEFMKLVQTIDDLRTGLGILKTELLRTNETLRECLDMFETLQRNHHEDAVLYDLKNKLHNIINKTNKP